MREDRRLDNKDDIDWKLVVAELALHGKTSITVGSNTVVITKEEVEASETNTETD